MLNLHTCMISMIRHACSGMILYTFTNLNKENIVFCSLASLAYSMSSGIKSYAESRNKNENNEI